MASDTLTQQVFTSKARAFVAIDSLEQDLRRCILQYLLDHLDQEQVFGGDVDDLRRRRDADPDGDRGLVTDYLFLRQAYDTLLRHRQLLPRDLGDLLVANTGALHDFVSIRNRVMHGRPLQLDDLDGAHSFVARFRSRYFSATESVLASLTSDPHWQPAFATRPAPVERVLHNLPSADFDETGLVGRSDEVRQVIDLLVRGRDRMITLTGEGGIGKTALALEACYNLVDSRNPPFEAVLWVSLKNERLTADGIRTISDAVRDVSGATQELGQSLDSSFKGNLEELSDYLSGLRALVVIDNLESAQGNEILAFYDALPESVSFLFTSRVGIGQIERRVPVVGLKERDSVLLLRKFSSRRGQAALAALPNDVAIDVVARLRHSPLAIRWYVLSVEAGKTPTDALRNQAELLRFCVDNVYEALTADTKLMLAILRTLDRPISFDELAVVASLEIDTLRRAAQVLSQGSLVVRTPAFELGDPDLLELSATARAYLPRVDVDSAVMSGVLDRESAFLRDREEARLAAAKRVLDPNVVRSRSAEDEPTAHLLRLALRLAKSADVAGAEAQLERARMLNPGYYEVDRVDAFMASNRGNTLLAAARYRDALSLCLADEEKARVRFFLAGHLARVGHDLEGALGHAKYAHHVLASAETAMALGNYLVWDKQYVSGQELLEGALEETTSQKSTRIITTAIVDSWRRWAEDELDERMPESSLEKGLAGVHTGKLLLNEGAHDYRLADAVARALLVAVRALKQLNSPNQSHVTRIKSDLHFLWTDGRFRSVDSWDRLSIAVHQLPDGYAIDWHPSADFVPTIDRRTKANAAGRSSRAVTSRDAIGAESRRTGVIVTRRESYAFIAHPDFPGNVFFHFGSLMRAEDSAAIREGVRVNFDYSQDDEGRDRAQQVSLAS